MAAIVVVLVVANVGSNRVVPEALYLPWAWASTAAVLVVAVRLDGRTGAELGLGRDRRRAGLLVGGAVVALTAAVMLLGALLPATQDLYRDDRVAEASLGGTLFDALVRVPLGTVLLEEVAFRGAVLAMLAARTTRTRALVISSLVFGLWHILPGWEVGTVNPTLRDLFGDAGRIVPVAAAVASTTLAGLVLGLFRERSGSLLAPMLVHWSTNGLGYLFAYAVITWT